jgi:hypothetical protein
LLADDDVSAVKVDIGPIEPVDLRCAQSRKTAESHKRNPFRLDAGQHDGKLRRRVNADVTAAVGCLHAQFGLCALVARQVSTATSEREQRAKRRSIIVAGPACNMN